MRVPALRVPLWMPALALLALAGVTVAQGFLPGGTHVLEGVADFGDLWVFGDAGVSNNVGIDGTLAVTGQATFSGFVQGRDAGFNRVAVTAGFHTLDANGTLAFNGTTGPALGYGGPTTVQATGSNGIASPGTLMGGGILDVRGYASNASTGANCLPGNGASFCVNDPSGLAGSNGASLTMWNIDAAGTISTDGGVNVGDATGTPKLGIQGTDGYINGADAGFNNVTGTGTISGDVGVSSGAWAVTYVGILPESTNLLGAYNATLVGRGSRFRQICCTCRVAGTNGSTGIVLNLMGDGSAVTSVEINGADSNACNDAAGTVLCGDLNYVFTAGVKYAVQVDPSTDCTINPTDCSCNTDVTR